MEKRYQVFVSSTFADLEAERQEVMHALLELDCLPSGMELFPAANESQWSLIKKVIDDSDYYLLILGGRYGSLGPDGISYTEMEYRYATEIGKPIIAFVHRNPEQIIAAKTETSDEGKGKLKEFRALVEQKICKHWGSPEELGSVVSRSLVRLMKTTPAIGWVRANEVPDRDAALELLRLRKRVDELQTELTQSRTSAPKGTENLSQGSELLEVEYSFHARAPDYATGTFTADVDISWNQLFAYVAPIMIQEASDRALRAAIDLAIEDPARKDLAEDKELEDYVLQRFAVTEATFQTIKVQFRALGLITISAKARSVKDSSIYWTLTPYGDEVMTRLRAIRSSKKERADSGNLFGGLPGQE